MESLSLPISDEASCGEYLKANKILYRALRNNFNQAQSSYRQLMESPDAMSDDELVEANTNNWRTLGDSCKECLENNSKDIEIFCWFISAQLFSADPLNNVRDALNVFGQVIDNYWDDLQPKPPVEKLKSDDEAGQAREWAEFKVKPLWQLAGESENSGLMAMPLSNLALVGAINYTQFYSAERAGSLQSLKDEAKQVFASNSGQLQEKIVALDAIIKAAGALEKSVNGHCLQVKAKPISFKFIIKGLNNLLAAMKFLLADSFATWPLDIVEQQQAEVSDDTEAPAEEVQESKTQTRSSSATGGQVVLNSDMDLYHRDQAFAQLRTIADFFRRTEPHSPIHMLLERSIRWGYMSLPQLLEEMVGGNEQAMQSINLLAGLESVEKTSIPKAIMSSAELERHQTHNAVKHEFPVADKQPSGIAVKTVEKEKANESKNEVKKARTVEW